MKRYILLIALTLAVAVSCDRKKDFTHETFATFSHTTYSINETVGQVVVPVRVYNPTGADLQVSVEVTSGNAVEGEDYEIVSPASGILTFSGDVDSLAVVVDIVSHEGEFTGSKNFGLKIASLSDGLTVGNFNTSNVVIVDVDHPLSKYFGTWSGTMGGNFQAGSYSMSMSIAADPDDETFTKMIIDSGLDPFFTSMGYNKATYSAVATETGFVVTAGQPNGYGDVVLYGFDENFEYAGYDIEFVMNADGTLSNVNGYGAYTPSQGGFYEIYNPGAVLSK